MDIDNGLFVVGIDCLEGSALDARDKFIVDEAGLVSKEFMHGLWFKVTYSPVGCSYVRRAVLIVFCMAMALESRNIQIVILV